jgi:guanylate kinase
LSRGKPSLIVVSAPSGAGKSTVLSRVLAEMPGLRFSVSHTTRPPRPGEQDGVHYHFVSAVAFEGLKAGGAMLEWAEVHGHLYGTALGEFQRAVAENVDLLLDLDVQGAAQVRMKVDDAVTLFILPPSYEDLERRLRGRGEEAEPIIRRRLDVAREEVSLAFEYDYAVVNDDLDACVESVKSVIKAARSRGSRMAGQVRRILETFDSRGREGETSP